VKRAAVLALAVFVAAPRLVTAQADRERGAAALGELIRGLGVTARVLMIGAHPDDEDTQLITWLARGRGVETAYLSLTRGDGGQNLIGNELGEALGVIRTEELLAARRIDGGRQYFTRAYDFGFSKSAEETYQHWPKDSILKDVVAVVRAFRPHVIVAVFSGTPRDGHGHHQVSGLLAREAFDLSGDTVRMPRDRAWGLGAWTPLKFYRAARFAPETATLRFNVGEYSRLLGRSYAEVAGESRSQHLSQGFGTLQPKGVRFDYLRLEATRTDTTVRDTSIFAGLEPGWPRFAALSLQPRARAAIDSLPVVLARAARVLDLREPSSVVPSLAAYLRLLSEAREAIECGPSEGSGWSEGSGCWTAPQRCGVFEVPLCAGAVGDLAASLGVAHERASRALALAAGVAVEATAARELVGVSDSLPVIIDVYNRGTAAIEFLGARVGARGAVPRETSARDSGRMVPPDSTLRVTLPLTINRATFPWWLTFGRVGDLFQLGDERLLRATGLPLAELVLGEDRVHYSGARVRLRLAGVRTDVDVAPIVYKFADPAKGERRRPIAAVPMVTVLLDRQVEYAPAGVALDRVLRAFVRSTATAERRVEVSLVLPRPRALSTDSADRTVTLPGLGSATLYFRIRGTLAPGTHRIGVLAGAGSQTFTWGFFPIAYEHIRPQRFYRPATVEVSAVDIKVPAALRVAYVPGVGDNVAPMLQQLGVPVTVIDPTMLPVAELSRFTTLVIGPRAYESNDALVANAATVLDFARRGGTVVVQYGQHEMTQPGIMPYPITLERRADRVTDENAPVRVLDPASRVLTHPNRIADADFAGWVQERALYMPRTFDARYQAPLSMNDPGEPPNRGAILVAPVGRGTYVYTTLSFFRQLPAGHPGAARLFVNLLSAGRRSAAP
jgi:LmbE family N-acetylglucosaminyl deacetylase